MSRLIYFGPYVIDVEDYSVEDLDELRVEAFDAVLALEDWIEEDEDGLSD